MDRHTFGKRVRCILGGPPFVRYKELNNKPEFVKQLRKRFASIKAGQFDLYMPFNGIRFGDLLVDFFHGAVSKSDELFMLRDRGVNFHGIQYGSARRSKERVRCEKELTVPIIRGREIKSVDKFLFFFQICSCSGVCKISCGLGKCPPVDSGNSGHCVAVWGWETL